MHISSSRSQRDAALIIVVLVAGACGESHIHGDSRSQPPDEPDTSTIVADDTSEHETASDEAQREPSEDTTDSEPRADTPPRAAPDTPPSAASDAPSSAAGEERPWPADCEVRRVFRAHGESKPGDTSKYRVAANAQYVVNFYFDSPWKEDMQLLAARPLVDNRAVVHHWVLWAIQKAGPREGEIVGGPDQLYPSGDPTVAPLMAAGAGSTDLEMPEGVGLGVGRGDEIEFMLDVHYVNLGSDEVQPDASGVEVCLTSKKRPNEAALHELGKLSFQLPPHEKTDVTTTCKPSAATAEARITAITPHMHRTGSHAKVVLHRKSGEEEVLHDQPYVYDEQRTYQFSGANEIVLHPGDSLTTTCTFDNATDAVISAGERNEDEMCRVFTVAWPKGALSNGSFVAFSVGQPIELACMER